MAEKYHRTYLTATNPRFYAFYPHSRRRAPDADSGKWQTPMRFGAVRNRERYDAIGLDRGATGTRNRRLSAYSTKNDTRNVPEKNWYKSRNNRSW